jgi:hypothetical protein
MTRTGALRYAAAYVVCGALGVAAGWALAALHNGGTPATVTAGVADTSAHLADRLYGSVSFTVRGRVAGLVPGKQAALRLRVSNPHAWRIRVLTVSVTIEDASAKCRAARNIAVRGYNARRMHAKRYIVAGHGTADMSLPIKVVNAPHRNQDACKHAVFPLRYAGTAARFPA